MSQRVKDTVKAIAVVLIVLSAYGFAAVADERDGVIAAELVLR